MTKTTFVNGTPVSSDFLNSLQNIQFDGQDFDGHYPRITNNDLSNEPSQIKPEWQSFRDSLKVSPGNGLAINYTGGSVTLQNDLIATISPGSIAIVDNVTNYIFVNELGVVQAALALPVRCIPLASATTASGVISGAIADLRPRFQVKPRFNAVVAFGSGGYEGDLVVNANTTLSGERYVKNFTLNSGATITVPGYLRLVASGNVIINGAIVVTPIISGGKGFAGVANAQQFLADSGFGLGGGGGHNSVPSPPYPYSASPFGSGGAAGFASVSNGNPSIVVSRGGYGGGALIIEAAGSLRITGSISCDGGNAVAGNATGAGTTVVIVLPGGGGGSGGLIWAKSLNTITVAPSAVLSVRGGSGAAGVRYNYASSSNGGGGGGGGYVVLNSPNTNTTGSTISLSGGAAGAISGPPPGVAGSIGGSFGGQGGTENSPGGNGQLVLQSFAPV